jgi:hypothetical protein
VSASGQADRTNRKELIGATEDSESFGKTVNFLGTLRGGSVVLDPTCNFEPGEFLPEDRCIVLQSTSGLTSFDERNLGYVVLPGNTARTNIYMINTYIVNYQFRNDTGSFQNDALFVYTPYITIESAALNDPRALDPATHLPLNGKLDIELSSKRVIDRSLSVDERFSEQLNYSRALVSGINKSYLVGLGLPSDIVDNIFKSAITIRENLRGKARHVNTARLVYASRLMGN